MENSDAGGAHTQPEPSPVASTAVKRRSKGPFEWIWRARTLAEARAALKREPALEAVRLSRARRALELADRAFDPVDQLQTGSSVALSLSLYREAAYWALLAQHEALSAPGLREALAKSDAELLRAAAKDEDSLSQVARALVDKDFVATAEDTEEIQRRDAAVVRDFVHALVRQKLEPKARVGRLLLQRWVRTLFLCAATLALVVGGAFAIRELSKGPDLAAGKPWRASSQYPGCQLDQHMCNGLPVRIFFHTNEEDQPWVQFDLGRKTRFAHVELVNRSDAGADRAYPIVIEVSDDAQKWREVARRTTPYSTWRADFAPVEARYVRARLLKRTFFHLERFSVYAP